MPRRTRLSMFLLLLCGAFFFPGRSYASDETSRFGLFKNLVVAPEDRVSTAWVVKGDLVFQGTAKNIIVLFGNAHMGSRSVLHGNIYVVGGTVGWEEGASVGGEVFQLSSDWQWLDALQFFVNVTNALRNVSVEDLVRAAFLGLVICIGLILLLFFPKLIQRSSDHMSKTLLGSFFWGVLFHVVIFGFLGICVLTVVGLVLVPVIGLLEALIYFFAMTVVSLKLGDALLFWKKQSSRFLSFSAGSVIVFLVSFLMPHLTWVFHLACIPATGALVRSIDRGGVR